MVATYKKTAAGLAELERRSTRLRPEQRRLLILIDGKHSLGSLAPLFRTGEIEHLIDELATLGMIESATNSTAYIPTTSVHAGRAMLGQVQLRAAIDAAKAGVREWLGRDAKDFVAKLDACRDSQALRIVVSEIQLRLIAVRDEDAATAFVISIRNANSK